MCSPRSCSCGECGESGPPPSWGEVAIWASCGRGTGKRPRTRARTPATGQGGVCEVFSPLPQISRSPHMHTPWTHRVSFQNRHIPNMQIVPCMYSAHRRWSPLQVAEAPTPSLAQPVGPGRPSHVASRPQMAPPKEAQPVGSPSSRLPATRRFWRGAAPTLGKDGGRGEEVQGGGRGRGDRSQTPFLLHPNSQGWCQNTKGEWTGVSVSPSPMLGTP